MTDKVFPSDCNLQEVHLYLANLLIMETEMSVPPRTNQADVFERGRKMEEERNMTGKD